MITVIARYQTQPGRGNEVASILSRHIPPSRAEPGCLAFVVNRSVDDPDHFVLYEQYADEPAFQAHRATPHFRDYIEGRVIPLLLERMWDCYDIVEPVPHPGEDPAVS